MITIIWTTLTCLQKTPKEPRIVKIFSLDMGIEFDIKKYTILIMKSGKRQITEGTEVPNPHQKKKKKKKNPKA